MIKSDPKGRMVIVLSFGVAMFMNLLPLPHIIQLFKPDFVALVLIYWVMAIPDRMGVISGWIVGLFVDALYGNVLGIHAMSFALMAYLILMTYHRLRLFPRWKQSINIAVVIGIHMLVAFVLRNFLKPISSSYVYWLPLVGAMLFWPWIFILLRDARRKFCH